MAVPKGVLFTVSTEPPLEIEHTDCRRAYLSGGASQRQNEPERLPPGVSHCQRLLVKGGDSVKLLK